MYEYRYAYRSRKHLKFSLAQHREIKYNQDPLKLTTVVKQYISVTDINIHRNIPEFNPNVFKIHSILVRVNNFQYKTQMPLNSLTVTIYLSK